MSCTIFVRTFDTDKIGHCGYKYIFTVFGAAAAGGMKQSVFYRLLVIVHNLPLCGIYGAAYFSIAFFNPFLAL